MVPKYELNINDYKQHVEILNHGPCKKKKKNRLFFFIYFNIPILPIGNLEKGDWENYEICFTHDLNMADGVRI